MRSTITDEPIAGSEAIALQAIRDGLILAGSMLCQFAVLEGQPANQKAIISWIVQHVCKKVFCDFLLVVHADLRRG
jgi:hypothetical protein